MSGSKITRITVCLLWLLAVGTGFSYILSYQNASGRSGDTPQHWPSKARITRDSTHDTLLMFIHPHCPCTRASIEELNRLMAKSQGRAAVQVFVFRPRTFSGDWTQTDLWRSAAAIPGVAVHEDLDGEQAAVFGAETSGHVMLYDTGGQLLFSGGITGSRGHAGDNAGEDAVYAFLQGENMGEIQTQVYGCSLLECKMPAGISR